MNDDLFRGKLVRLCMDDPSVLGEHFARWSRNSEYSRLGSTGNASPHSIRQTNEWSEKRFSEISDNDYRFTIHTLEDDRFIGDIELDGIMWPRRESYVGIGIGDPENWGKGYGSDAMRLVLRFAFTELNLRRVTLNTFEYNPRAIRSYEIVGFRHEGKVRQYLNREGQRWDLVYMGILKEEWIASGGER